jgi:hypothetical protein
MAFNIKSLLKDKNVLYLVMFVSVTNFFVYLITHNWNAAIIFTLIAYLTTYFSKNMIIVLLIALISTNMIISTRLLRVMEGFKDGEDKNDEKKEDKKEDKKDSPKKDGYTNKNDINYAATVEQAYQDLDKLIGQDGIDKMTQDTAKLVDQQSKLLKNLENMTPLLENAGKLLDTLPLNGMNDVQGSLKGLVSNLKGMANK